MRKYSILVLTLITLVATSVGCIPLLEKDIRIPLTFFTDASFKLDPTQQTGYQELSVDLVPSDLQEFLDQNNANFDNIDRATIKELSLNLATPGLSFGILSDVKVEIEVKGERLLVGNLRIPSPEAVSIEIPVENEIDVLELLREEQFHFVLSGTLREPLEEEAKIDARVGYGLNMTL